ncbi:MAG: hypothetical protein IJ672_10060 [Methanobrevibacter sp.]|nr:hypothetical protein [Methanobrevibacter sp.]
MLINSLSVTFKYPAPLAHIAPPALFGALLFLNRQLSTVTLTLLLEPIAPPPY